MQTMMFAAQIIGPAMVLISLSMLARAGSMIPLVEVMLQNPPLLFVCGVGQLLAGLTIVILPDTSSGQTLPLVLVFVGWWLIARGLTLIFLTQDALWALVDSIELPKYHFLSNSVGFVIGAYLTWTGFGGLVGLGLSRAAQ